MRVKVIILFLLTVVVMTSSCSAKQPIDKRAYDKIIVTDTTMHRAVGDSIYRIITNAKKVEITSLPLQSDSIKEMMSKKVASKDLELMKFIATNPKNYMTNTALYGEFIPQFQAVYIYKKSSVALKYDFGLRKWGIFDATDKLIKMFDLASDNMLRFACKMFPDNQFLNELLLTRE